MRALLSLPWLLLLVACGGGGGSSSTGGQTPPPPPPSNQSPGGIWTVTYTVASGPNAGNTIKAQALATENGDYFFAGVNQQSGCATVGFGQLSVSGSSVSGSVSSAIVTVAAAPGINTSCTYPDGTTSGTGTVSGTVAQRSSMTLTETTTTSMGTVLASEANTWLYSSLYSEPSSLQAIAGNYADGANTLTISSNGTLFEQDAATGCVLNGQVAPVNPSYNAYSVTFTFANCTGTAAVANGVTATGLAYVDNSASPVTVPIGVKFTYSGQFGVFVSVLTKM